MEYYTPEKININNNIKLSDGVSECECQSDVKSF